MQKVNGIGGIFFKSKDPGETARWYEKCLGIQAETWGDSRGTAFEWRHKEDPERPGFSVWSIFPDSTSYFGPDDATFMINYRVADLDAMLEQLRDAGATLAGEPVEEYNGRFAWVMDPDGRKIELWEPAPGH